MIPSPTTKISDSILAISRCIANGEKIQESVREGVDIVQDISEYVAALVIYFMAADGKAADEELDLMRAIYMAHDQLGFDFPLENQVEWAQDKLRETPFFFNVAIIDDRNEAGHNTSTILWHVRHIICTIINVDGDCADEEITEARLYLETLQNQLDSQSVEWSYDYLESPPELLRSLSSTKKSKLHPAPQNEYNNRMKSSSSEDNADENIEVCLAELDALIGLDGVKQEVRTIVNLMKVQNMREARGLKMPEMSLHMVFSGNPGTGKTTVARLLARIYKALGVLPRGHVVEVDRSGLVAGYVGQTAIKTMEALKKSHGGILFIDEAYSLLGPNGNDFGQESIDTILKYMEDNRGEIVIIVAGYTNEMREFVKSNPGLQSRFNKFINFGDYSIAELYSILVRLVESHQYVFNEQVGSIIYEGLSKSKSGADLNFANARVVRNLFESIVQEQANRIADEDHSDESVIHIIEEVDVRTALARKLL